jgi:transcriptional regulator with XRE-family HTH domain
MTQPRDWLTQPGGLADRLVTMRESAGLTGRALADAAGWPGSKISKIEKGKQTPTAADIDVWVRLCGTDPTVGRELLTLLEDFNARHRTWRRRLRLGQTDAQEEYRLLVEESSLVRHFETAWIPGLLQTAAYARSVLAEIAELHGAEVDDLHGAIEKRMRRQQYLYDSSKRFEFLLCEPVLHWWKPPAPVMREQLDRLHTVVDMDRIRFGIYPTDAVVGTTPQNAFVMYDDRAFVETFLGETVHEGDDAERYAQIMERMWADAVTGPKARRLIVAAAEALPG